MKPVKVVKQRAPSYSGDTDPDCVWSLGILNLTEAEADTVSMFASRVRTMGNDRASGQGYTATEMRDRVSLRARGVDPDPTPTYRCSQGHLVPGGPGEECQLCVRDELRMLRGDGPTRVGVTRDALDNYKRLRDDADEIMRRKAAFLTGDWDVNDKEKEPLTTPAEAGNRFSGLDLGSDSK